jgi:hypothetical protein
MLLWITRSYNVLEKMRGNQDARKAVSYQRFYDLRMNPGICSAVFKVNNQIIKDFLNTHSCKQFWYLPYARHCAKSAGLLRTHSRFYEVANEPLDPSDAFFYTQLCHAMVKSLRKQIHPPE